MDTRKVTFVATIVVIALLAVGIGYAYTASTVNSGNNASSEYISLVQGTNEETSGAYQFANGQKLLWDTTDYKVSGQPKTDFSLASETISFGPGSAWKAVQLGKSFTLDALTNKVTPAATIDVNVAATNFVAPYKVSTVDKGFIMFKFDDGTNVQYQKVSSNTSGTNTLVGYNSSWAESSKNGVVTLYQDTGGNYKAATITAYYVCVDSVFTVNHDAGAFPTAPVTDLMNNAKLVFTVTDTGWNGNGTSVTNVSTSVANITTTVGAADSTFTVTVTAPEHATNTGFIAISNNTGVATVSVSGTTVTVHAVTAGATTITIITEEGGLSVDVPVTVNASS